VADAHGDSAQEANVLAELALRYPATFYGSLARERLATLKADARPAIELNGLMQQGDALDEREALERLTPAITALNLGREDAVAELTTSALRHPSPAANRITVEVLEAAGATLPAYRFARAVFRAQPGDREAAPVWEAAFPTHFSELIAFNAGKANVTPHLLQGLVREESAFEPSARSHCGALGLMQLMPVTARALSREEGGALESTSELLDPKLNVHLGSRYFGQLLRRFDGNRIAATAAYNGGPTRVAGWLKLSNARQSDEWLEEIPLDETRNYVKDVLASADVYRYRLADRAFGLAAVAR
jgi:soluble lytic murein transglycosylase